jgi:O-antigen/teichoic acid export membrane protein
MFWAVTETGGTAALSIVTMLIMARIMGASEFGIAALIIGCIQLLNLFVEGLFHDALIQNRRLDDDAFDKAFSLVQLIASVLLLTAIGAIPALGGSEWERTSWLVLGAALSLPFSGALGIANARLRREFQFRDVARASVLGKLLGSACGVVLALSGFGAWSLIGQYTASVMLQALILYWNSSWRPCLRLSFGSLEPLCRFALPYALMHSLVAVRLQGFMILVAMSMGVTIAGYVNVSFRLTTTPQILLTTALMNFGFPLLSKHQASKADLHAAFHLITRIITLTTTPAFVGLALSADDLVPLMLGPEWETSIPLVQILSLGVAISFIRLSSSFLLRAQGFVKFSFYNSAFQLIVTLGGMVLLWPREPVMAAMLWVCPVFVQLPATIWIVRRVTGMSVRQQLEGSHAAIVATSAMAAVLMAVMVDAASSDHLIRLGVKLIVGVSVFGLLVIARDAAVRKSLFIKVGLARCRG